MRDKWSGFSLATCVAVALQGSFLFWNATLSSPSGDTRLVPCIPWARFFSCRRFELVHRAYTLHSKDHHPVSFGNNASAMSKVDTPNVGQNTQHRLYRLWNYRMKATLRVQLQQQTVTLKSKANARIGRHQIVMTMSCD